MPSLSQLSPDNILRFLQVRSAPASSDEIAAALHMRKTERRALYKMLSTLTKRRAIEELPGGRYRLAGRRDERNGDGQRGQVPMRQAGRSPGTVADERPATAREGGGIASHNEIKGRLVLHHDGYGFVVPDPPVPWLDRDVFIPRDAVEDAMHGDQVLVKMQRVIEIPPGMELTPGLAKKLGFSGADERSVRGRRIPRLEELDGAVVNVEVVRYPRGGMAATGRVIEILGRPGELGVDTEIIIRKHHLPHVFPAEVIKEAEQRALPVQEAELAGRQDFRRLPIVTIDGETARDFDDAVYVERRVDGGWHLQVHIADVAHYVRTLTALDGEARLRGTSVYFPDRAVPMLPEALSNGMCSLKPREDRLVMSAVIEFDEQQRMINITRSERNIAHRLIEEFMLAANRAVAGYLLKRGIEALHRVHEKPDARKVLEFEELARAFGYSLGVEGLQQREIAVRHGRVPSPAKAGRPDSYGKGRERGMRVALPGAAEDLRIAPQHYQRLLQKIEGKPEERIVSYLMLRSLKQARYAADSLGHFALGFDEYTHFTSPIRRYPDLIVHRTLKWALEHPQSAAPPAQAGQAARGTEAVMYSHGQLEEMAAETSEAERRANGAERELMDWKTAQFMEEHLGEEYDGLIISVQKYGCFVELFEVFVEGLLPITALEEFANARCVLRERDHTIVAMPGGGGRGPRRSHGAKPRQLECHLGDKVRVRAERI